MITQDLTDRALTGEAQAITSLIIEYIPIIRSRISMDNIHGIDGDDLLQEGLMGLTKAITSFNREVGVKFTTFATVCIDNQISDARKKARRKKHAILSESIPLAESDAVSDENPQECVEGREAAMAVRSAIETMLTPMERKILLYFLEGLSYENIAKKLSITPKAVDNGLQRVRKKIKETGE